MTKPLAKGQDIKPYQELMSHATTQLDKNEGTITLFKDASFIEDIDLSKYPESSGQSLRKALANRHGIKETTIMIGNGSSELIDLLIKTYASEGQSVMAFEPTFSMYRIYAETHGVSYAGIDTNDDFVMDVDQMIEEANKISPAIIFLCSPNNPTGAVIPDEDIQRLVSKTKALVVLDEAYIEFSKVGRSFLVDATKASHLVVLRTFSKAYGLAGIRLGYMVSSEGIINDLFKMSAPYRVNSLSQTIGMHALGLEKDVREAVEAVIRARTSMVKRLIDLGLKVFPTEGNFVFFQTTISHLGRRLIEKDVLIRTWNEVQGTYRVTIGTDDQNNTFLRTMEEIINEG